MGLGDHKARIEIAKVKGLRTRPGASTWVTGLRVRIEVRYQNCGHKIRGQKWG